MCSTPERIRMTEEQLKKLRSLPQDRSKQRWSGNRTLRLTHIVQQTGNTVGRHPTQALEQGIVYWLERQEYISKILPHTIGMYWLTATIYMIQETINGGYQYGTYLYYLAFMDWKEQDKLRSSRRKREKLIRELHSFTYQYKGKSYRLFNQLVKEGHKAYEVVKLRGQFPLSISYNGEFTKSSKDYVSLEQALSEAVFNSEFSYSFDK